MEDEVVDEVRADLGARGARGGRGVRGVVVERGGRGVQGDRGEVDVEVRGGLGA